MTLEELPNPSSGNWVLILYGRRILGLFIMVWHKGVAIHCWTAPKEVGGIAPGLPARKE